MKIIISLILSTALLFVSCEYESEITKHSSDLETQSLNKKPIQGEFISFEGDFTGSQLVFGCCPNAGPFPDYRMTLSGELPAGTYDGHVFMNVYGNGKNKSYIVQFWWMEAACEYFIEVKGGVLQEDRKNKTLTVTFANEPCRIWIDNVLIESVPVIFVLTRSQQ